MVTLLLLSLFAISDSAQAGDEELHFLTDSPPASAATRPDWVNAPSRTVVNGYIIFVGTGEGPALARATSQAEGMALSSLIDECTLPPRGARVEAYYDERSPTGRRAYARVAVEYDDCEQGKKAITPEDIRNLTNPQMLAKAQAYEREVASSDPLPLQAQIDELQSEVAEQGTGQVALPEAKQLIAGEAPGFTLTPEQQTVIVRTVILPGTLELRREELADRALLAWQHAEATQAIEQLQAAQTHYAAPAHAPVQEPGMHPRAVMRQAASVSEPRVAHEPARVLHAHPARHLVHARRAGRRRRG